LKKRRKLKFQTQPIKTLKKRLNPSVSPLVKRGNHAEAPWDKFLPYLALTASFLFCFKDWFSRFNSEIFLSLDSTVLYYPVYQWVHQHLAQDKLPLICDLAYHGAPLAAVSMAGVLSPVLWIFHLASSPVVMTNLIFLAPFAIFLFGTYVLGRQMGFSVSACLLLAFLWTYNGQRMAQLDHWNVAWACAFFPWAFWALLRHYSRGSLFWLALSGLFWGLNLLSGHPQIFFLEGLFFLSWAFLSADSRLSPFPQGERARVRGIFNGRLFAVSGLLLGALIVASPLLFFTFENLGMDGFHFQWGEVDRFFHSWTPLNFLTLLFPWFFGRDQFDRADSTYWWQYQFVEMQVAFSIIGLFFILLFLLGKNPQRRWIGWTALFGLAMALGKFFLVYGLVQSLPIFSWFRDPARYWHLITWVVGLGAAYAWDEWFNTSPPHPSPLPPGARGNNKKTALFPSPSRGTAQKLKTSIPPPLEGEGRVRGIYIDEPLFRLGRNLALGLAGFSFLAVLLGGLLLHFGRTYLVQSAAWAIQRFLLGDSLHQQPLSAYLARLPEKLGALTESLNPANPWVLFPFLFLAALAAVILNRKNGSLDLQKGILLALVFADLMIFQMPLGDVFYKPSDIPAPAYEAPANRSLVMLYRNTSPLPPQYGEMAYPNMNLVSGRPNLVIDANPALPGYDKILKEFGWFSWVYQDRDPVGFSKHIEELRLLGVDQIVSDKALDLPDPFETVRDHYPFVYSLPGAYPKACIGAQPMKSLALDLESTRLKVLQWDETRLAIDAKGSESRVQGAHGADGLILPDLLLLQKTFLPGWKAALNGVPTKLGRNSGVLISVPLRTGDNLVSLRYEPLSLRAGFFLFFLFFGVFTFLLLRLWTA